MKTLIFSPATPSHLPPFHLPPVGISHLQAAGCVINFRCKAVSNYSKQDHVYPRDWRQKMKHRIWRQHTFIRHTNIMDQDPMDTNKILYPRDEIRELVEKIKVMLDSMDDGGINVSAYDTAWVALVEDVNGNARPQFPSCLEWIVNNQLPDGSWGDRLIFLAYDRIISTLACVVALTFWNIHPNKCQKGVKFLKENISKLENENVERMLSGFEVVLPSLIDIGKKLNIEVPEDSPVLKEIYARRNLKLAKIPKNILHEVPTTLLFSLEGMQDLEWEKLAKLQCKNGSFLFSPSSTAFAFLQTNDENCLQYLTNVASKFNGGVPNLHPVDLFERIWVVDRLQRLGISRYFKSEIECCVEYIHRYGKPWQGLMVALQGTLQGLSSDALMANSRDIHPQLYHAWEMWLTRWHKGGDPIEGQAELIVQTMNMIAGRWTSKELLADPQYQWLSTITNNLCLEISDSSNSKEKCIIRDNETANAKRDHMMQQLVQLVFSNSPDDLDNDLKQTYLTVVKTFYYKTYFDPETINVHISKVLFENVI